jgi:hypothetical protein
LRAISEGKEAKCRDFGFQVSMDEEYTVDSRRMVVILRGQIEEMEKEDLEDAILPEYEDFDYFLMFLLVLIFLFVSFAVIRSVAYAAGP